jgi:hypothetical protein
MHSALLCQIVGTVCSRVSHSMAPGLRLTRTSGRSWSNAAKDRTSRAARLHRAVYSQTMRCRTFPKSGLLFGIAVWAGIGLLGCAGGHGVAKSSTRPASGVAPTATPPPSKRYLEDDGDADQDDHGHPVDPNDDERIFAAYPVHASPAETRAVAALVKRYYRAAAAEDRTEVCALLSASLVTGLAAGQSAASGDPREACALAVSAPLHEQHPHLLADETADMSVIAVRLHDGFGIAIVGFRRAPESEILVEREGRQWKIDALADSDMP